MSSFRVGMARVPPGDPDFACRAGPGDVSAMLAVRLRDPGKFSDPAGAPQRPRRGPKLDRRPASPSLRLPLASMGRASFLRLVAVWLAAVIVVLGLALAVRWFG